MQTKFLFTAFIAICCVILSYAQTETNIFKRNPVPFDSKIPLRQQFIKPLPFVPYKNKSTKDTANSGYKTNFGEVFVDAQDGMPILKPYPQSTYHERSSILNPFLPKPFGNKSYVYPMPNPLNKALIVK